jgi:segregation and condensation protein B
MISGRNEKLPGHPLVYATSKNFMDYFGINSADDLPKIKEVLADQIVEPTRVHHTDFEQSETLLVSEDGQLVNAQPEEETTEAEGYVNGHTFDVDAQENPGTAEDQPTEDLPSEEAAEEFIADETFIEGDQIEESKETEGEIEGHESNESDAPEGETDNSSADGTDDEEPSGEEEK